MAPIKQEHETYDEEEKQEDDMEPVDRKMPVYINQKMAYAQLQTMTFHEDDEINFQLETPGMIARFLKDKDEPFLRLKVQGMVVVDDQSLYKDAPPPPHFVVLPMPLIPTMAEEIPYQGPPSPPAQQLATAARPQSMMNKRYRSDNNCEHCDDTNGLFSESDNDSTSYILAGKNSRRRR